jgi:Rieske Fe-S protein
MSTFDKTDSKSRRGFVNWLLGTSAGAFALSVMYPVVRFVVPPAAAESTASTVTLEFGPDEIAPNQGRPFRFGNRPGLLVRTPGGELRAFSAECTHLSCTVQYREDESRIWCACHNGFFDLNGVNVQGPPPRPLEDFEVNVRGEQIVVSLKA